MYPPLLYKIILIVICVLCPFANLQASDQNIENGIIDLSQHDFYQNPVQSLDGWWNFWPSQHVPPSNLNKAIVDQVWVPGFWSSKSRAGFFNAPIGIGTYHLRIILHPSASETLRYHPWALDIDYQGTAYRLFVNGEIMAASGIAGLSHQSSKPEYRSQIIPLAAPIEVDGQLVYDLVFWVSNFHHRDGGLWLPVRFGDIDALERASQSRLFPMFFFCGAFILIGIYHLVLYFRRRSALEYLFFGIMSLLFCIHTLVSGSVPISYLFPNLSFELIVALEYTIPNISLIMCMGYFRQLFPKQFPLWLYILVSFLQVFYCLLVIISPAIVSTKLVLLFSALLGLNILGLMVICLIAALKRQSFGWLFFFSMTIAFTGYVIDTLCAMALLYLPFIVTPLTFCLMSLFQALLFSRRFWNYYSQNEILALRQQHSNALLQSTSDAIKRFIPDQVLKQLHKSDITQIALGDYIEQTKTLLFSDIRNFTQISESISIQDSFFFINRYLGKAGPVIQERGGYIEKYIGDAIMAVFDLQGDAALEAAIAMQRVALAESTENKKHNWPPVRIGIGIHSGPILLGIIGEESRISANLIAEAATIVGRIEALTKVLNAKILISKTVYTSLKNPEAYAVRLVDKLADSNGDLEILELLVPDIDPLGATKIQLTQACNTALQAYWSGDFSQARHDFKNLQMQCPEDPLYQVYVSRLIDLENGLALIDPGLDALEDLQ